MKKTLLCVLACLMGCFFLSGCDFQKIPEPEGIMEPTQAIYDALDRLEADPLTDVQRPVQERYSIVVDDGFGMKGFVAPFCMTYRAAISAVTSVSMSSERACYSASEYIGAMNGGESDSEAFFQNAVQASFFQSSSNDIAPVIAAMAESYENDPDQVMILISDLMIATEDDCLVAAKALQDAVVKPEHATMGIIGMIGEFRGSIENLPVSPVTGQKRKISDYMVLERGANGNFRHPLYMLFFGDDQAVLNAMEKSLSALKSCGLLDAQAQPKALYFSEYDISRNHENDITNTFSLGCQQYNLANYSAQFILRGVANKDGSVRYSAASAIPDQYRERLNKLQIAKIYDLARGNTENNVTIQCKTPFDLVDSSKNGASILDQHSLVKPAEKIRLDYEDYQVTVDIRMLEYTLQDGSPQARWVSTTGNLVRCNSMEIDANKENIEVELSVNTDLLKKDEPLLLLIDVGVILEPEWEEVSALYDTSWVQDWTLSLKDFDSEAIVIGKEKSSARFTSLTTAHTPFLSNLICVGIADEQVASVIHTLSDHSAAALQTTMFGLIVRDVPNRYVGNGSWDETEDFYGWAFSLKDAKEIQATVRYKPIQNEMLGGH